MTRVRIQTVEDAGATGQVFVRDTASVNGGAYAAAAVTAVSGGAATRVAVFDSATSIAGSANFTFTTPAALQLFNAGAGSADLSQLALVESVGGNLYMTLNYTNASFTPSGLLLASQGVWASAPSSAGGLVFTALSNSAAIVYSIGGFATADEEFRIDTNGVKATGSFSSAATAASHDTAGPTITVGNSSYIRLTLGASSSGNITLSDGVRDGQKLCIECISNGGSATLPDNTANNVRLSAAWTPATGAPATPFDTLTLHWNASDGNWIEDSRSMNG